MSEDYQSGYQMRDREQRMGITTIMSIVQCGLWLVEINNK